MKTYTTPTLVAYGDAAQITADSRENNTDDTFFDANGMGQPGAGGSLDVCTTADDQNCLDR